MFQSSTDEIAVIGPHASADSGLVSAPLDPRSILSSIGEVVYDWDLTSDELVWGPNVADLFGASGLSDINRGLVWLQQLTPDSTTSRYEAILKSTERDNGTGVKYQLQYGLTPIERDAGPVWVEDTGRWFGAPDGRPIRAHGVLRLVQAKSVTDRADAPSRFDPLTGTSTRTHLINHLDRMLAAASGTRRQFSLLIACVENLAWLNRQHGFAAADEVVIGVAERLRTNLRTTDIIARYSGNKFALVLDNCDAAQAAGATRRCISMIADAPFQTSAGSLGASLRIGSIVSPKQGRTHHLLLQRAEEALEAARLPTSLDHVAYSPNLAKVASRQRTRRISDVIVSALNDRRIDIALEPIVSASDRLPVFYEALLRLRLEDGTVSSPAAIIPVAEETGLISLIDHRVLELAVARLSADACLRVSVNMSGATTRDPDWPARIAAVLGSRPGVAERLTIEITETCAIADLPATSRAIAELKKLGLRIAMDDFGAGHTSFRNLRALGIDIIKIDGAFVQNLTRSADDRFFVRTLVELAGHLGIPTVAEWVEDEETARLLESWGVDYFQGIMFDRSIALHTGAAAA